MGRPQRLYTYWTSKLDALLIDIGLVELRSPPPTTYKDCDSTSIGYKNWHKRCVRHVAAVLKGRDPGIIFAAMMRNEQAEQFIKVPEVQRSAMQAAAKTMQEHWTPRLTVFLWDRLELSRRECENMRNLLSFKYHPQPLDKYIPLRLWENPDDPDDFVAFPILPGRYARENEYAALAAAAQIQVSPSGNSCQRDAVVAASELYSAYGAAMRTNYSLHRPAQPTFLFDGTGQSLGKGLCHAEMGSADFTGDTRQSRKTLQPLQASEGNDHAISIRETMEYAASSFNELIRAAKITLENGTTIPARPIASADFQAVKAMTATSEQTHAIWCTCLGAVKDSGQHKYITACIPCEEDNVEAAYASMLKYIERDPKGPRCHFKSYDQQCRWNHVCPSVARGGKFKRFRCELCDYNPTEAAYNKAQADFHKKGDAEQKEDRKAHRENGCTTYQWNRHHFGELYMSPMLDLDFRDIGVDMLHLVYLNVFKHIFNYTVHQSLPGDSVRAHMPASDA